MRWDDVVALVAHLPEVHTGTSYGTPCLKVRGKQLARLQEDGEGISVHVDLDERDALVAGAPEALSVPAHYLRHRYVRAELATVDPELLRELLEDAWRDRAPRRVVQAFDAGR